MGLPTLPPTTPHNPTSGARSPATPAAIGVSVLPERHGLVVGHLRDGLLPDVDTESRPVAESDMAVGQHRQTMEQLLEKTYAVMRGTQVGAHLCVGPQCARLAVKPGQLP